MIDGCLVPRLHGCWQGAFVLGGGGGGGLELFYL